MKKIIIAGYPKSGNTWLSRLTANLVGCPVEGFLYNPNNVEIAIEGTERVSDYRVYKSHHQLSELTKEDIQNSKIIYVVRDPRDVLCSFRKMTDNPYPNYLDSIFASLGAFQYAKFLKKKIIPCNLHRNTIQILYIQNKQSYFGTLPGIWYNIIF